MSKRVYWLVKISRERYAYDALFHNRADAVEYGYTNPKKVLIEYVKPRSKPISKMTKKEARACLVKLGTHTKTGRLTKNYR